MPNRYSTICSSDSATNSNAFERLPEEIIVQILQQTNPNGFASLVLLNRRWRQVSSQAHLYKHQLLRCPSYSAAHQFFSTSGQDNLGLSQLRRLFAREIKRNLFESYLRPEKTIFSLVLNSNSESFTSTRETFKYSLSPQGFYILAYSSCRILVMDATSQEIKVKRGLKILQRPASVTITDDGCTLAVFYTNLQVDLYDLTEQKPRHTQAIVLDHTPKTIALSPNGSILAAAYDSGIEVSSLTKNNLSTDRRSVKCYSVDSLTFSRDGTQILGTTINSQSPSTVVLTPPYFDAGTIHAEDNVSTLWTTSILFPNGSRDCSHAVLIPSSLDEEANWIFTYDRAFETFRAVRIDDLRNGTTYFTGPVTNSTCGSKLLPSSLPAATKAGDLIASSFNGFIWLYGIPGNLDTVTNCQNSSLDSSESVTQYQKSYLSSSCTSLTKKIQRQYEDSGEISQWQLLCDRTRNTLIEGRNISFFENVSELAWVNSSKISGDRLIAVASDVGKTGITDEAKDNITVDMGRIMILDFNHSLVNGKQIFKTIEVELDGIESLEENAQNIDSEVTRIRMQNLGGRQSHSNLVHQKSMVSLTPSTHRSTSEHLSPHLADSTSIDASFDAPYSHTSPRSRSTLRRAATAVAINRRLNSHAVHDNHTIEFRRMDGLEEYPHESDADEWVPPPPPYTLKSTAKLPEHIQRSLQVTTHHATNNKCDLSSNLSTNLNSCDEISENADEFVRDNFNNLQSYLDERIPLQTLDASVNYGFDDRYDVSPADTPPESPQLNLASRVSLENSLEDSSNEYVVPTSCSLLSGPNVSANFLQSGFSNGQSVRSNNNLYHSNGETVTFTDERLQTPVINSELVSQTQNGNLSLQDRSYSDFSSEQIALPQTVSRRAENRKGRLSMRLPLYNRLFSCPKDIREQRPSILRRRTTPESSSFSSIDAEKYKHLSGCSDLSIMSKKNLNPDNTITQIRHSTLELGSLLPSSVTFQESLDERLNLTSSSMSITSYPARTKGQDKSNNLFQNKPTLNPETRTHETPHHDSLSKSRSKNIASEVKKKIRRKSLFGDRGDMHDSESFVAHDDFRSNEIHIEEDCCSIREWETKQKKCAMM